MSDLNEKQVRLADSRNGVVPKTKLESFLEQVSEAITIKDSFGLRNWMSQEEFFEMLKTEGLETLSGQTRKQLEAGGDYSEFQLLLDRILLRRYLLSSRFDAFRQFTKANGIEIPSGLKNLLDKWNDGQPAYQSQMQFIKGLAELQSEDERLGSLIKEISVRFLMEHRSYVHVAATVESEHPLLRPAITFIVASDKYRKVTGPRDIFLFAQNIDPRFQQTVEGVQEALRLTRGDGAQYWYRLEVLQNLIRDGEIRLDGRSAAAAIGWLIFQIERDVSQQMPSLSFWGRYDPLLRNFRPVDGLREKLDACVEDGIRVIALPEAALNKPVAPGISFKDYAQQQKVHLIPFPDDASISHVYSLVLEKYQGLVASTTGAVPAPPDASILSRFPRGQLFSDSTGIYWVQHNKKVSRPEF